MEDLLPVLSLLNVGHTLQYRDEQLLQVKVVQGLCLGIEVAKQYPIDEVGQETNQSCSVLMLDLLEGIKNIKAGHLVLIKVSGFKHAHFDLLDIWRRGVFLVIVKQATA